MKIKQLIGVAFLAACGPAFGAVTIGLSSIAADNFANAAGTPTDGLYYGILVDTNGNGFSSTYTAPSPLALTTVYTMLSGTGAATGDVLITGDYLTYADTNSGTIYDIAGINLGVNGLAAAQAFQVVWFDGNKMGSLADASFTLPPDGNVQDYPNPFVGNDPIRTAGFAYSGTSGTPTGTNAPLVVVPEPSAVLLGAIGALGLLRRRRN